MTAHARHAMCRLRSMLGVVGLLVVGCSGSTKEKEVAPVEMANREAGVIARVGEERIVADEVGRIAAVQGVSVEVARDLAIRDALFATAAKEEGVDAERATQLKINAVLARRLLLKLLDDAERAGPATDAELERIMKRRWLELDRPEGFRVVHAVVRLKENADEATRDRAKVVAKAIREAVMPAAEMAKTTPMPRSAVDPVIDVFKKAAEGVERDGFEIKVEALDPVTADGRVLSLDGGGYEKPFAEGASKLGSRGELSELVLSSYGVHVVLLLERIPESRVPRDEQLRMVREEVVWMRSSEARTKLLDQLRKGASVGREVETLLVMVPVDR